MKITFICSGNVFRSVFAQEYLKKLAKEKNLSFVEIDSCGTIAQPHFKIPEILFKLLKVYGIDNFKKSEHKPTKICQEIVDKSDIILVMEKNHLEYIKKNFSSSCHKTFLLKEYAGFLSHLEIFDPIGQEKVVYIKTAEEIKNCLDIIIQKLIQKGEKSNVPS